MGLGRRDQARPDCAHAVEWKPDGRADRGMLAFIDKRYAEARKEWQAAIDEEPENAVALRVWMDKLPAR
jgi:hypothetical protein